MSQAIKRQIAIAQKFSGVPMVRSHEIADFKRCETKWYWHWRKGLVPKAVSMGALDLGTWIHAALEQWYQPGLTRGGDLAELFDGAAVDAINAASAAGAPDHQLEKADELRLLGHAVMTAYQVHYGDDPEIDVLATEIPLRFPIPSIVGGTVENTDKPIAYYGLKPDMVCRWHDGVWLVENKSAASIRTEHLTIDGQARPYGVLAARALAKAGVIKHESELKGILYNFMRKGLPDLRKQDAKGLYLNQNGTVSKKQPPVQFLRKPIILTRQAKLHTLRRLQMDVNSVAVVGNLLRADPRRASKLSKTPHWSCPRFCDYFAMCEMDENGLDTKDFERTMFRRADPYAYAETTDERATFEMG